MNKELKLSTLLLYMFHIHVCVFSVCSIGKPALEQRETGYRATGNRLTSSGRWVLNPDLNYSCIVNSSHVSPYSKITSVERFLAYQWYFKHNICNADCLKLPGCRTDDLQYGLCKSSIDLPIPEICHARH